MRDINFPPVEPLSLRAWVSVVVVVPSLSKGDEGEDEAVLAIVTGFESGLADNVSERVDAEGAVVEQRSADAETPREHLKWRGSELGIIRSQEVSKPRDCDSKKHWGNYVVTLQESKLWKPNEVLY